MNHDYSHGFIYCFCFIVAYGAAVQVKNLGDIDENKRNKLAFKKEARQYSIEKKTERDSEYTC